VEALLGFAIALAIGMTGFGGGTLTVPALILLWNVPAAQSIGTAMIFSTIVKLVAVPSYLVRGQISTRALVPLLAGGLPGVLAGTLLLARLREAALESAILVLVGATIALVAAVSLWKQWRASHPVAGRSRPLLLGALAFPIGWEVGFSSAGAGALGSLLLMSFAPLAPVQVVGTDLVFGLVLSSVGGGLHWGLGSVDPVLTLKLASGGVAGALAGSWLSTRVPARAFRLAILSLLVLLGAQLFWKGIVP
jgi:hypothetical protein